MAAIPESLIESELFGNARSTPPEAPVKHVGRIQAAHQGTLFIDEIGDLLLAAQTKLLRVLETQRVTRWAATKKPPPTSVSSPPRARICSSWSKREHSAKIFTIGSTSSSCKCRRYVIAAKTFPSWPNST